MENEESEEMEYRESFGDFLRRHREASGKTLDAIARTTRIPKRYLQAFEENDSARLPEEAFSRGFLRVYAMEVGLDIEETISRYERFQRSLMPTQIKEVRPSRSKGFADLGSASPQMQAIRLKGLVVLLSIVLVGGLTAWIGMRQGSRSASKPATPVAQAPAVVQNSTPTPAPEASAAATEGSTPKVQAPSVVTSSTPMATPVAPSSLTIKAVKKASVSLRLDDHPAQDLSLEAGDSKNFNVFREVELKGVERSTVQIQYNGRPLEISGPSMKLFNRNLYTSSSKP